MIETYSQYIEEYLNTPIRENRPCPGEHHFVSYYLVPRLYKLTGKVPDYINPDGTKNIIGDVVYYLDMKHQFGIEAKLETVRFTKNEFNNWIVGNNRLEQPNVFVGIANTGIAVSSWQTLREKYIKAVQGAKGESWKPTCISDGYGPMKSMKLLIKEFGPSHSYLLSENKEKSVSLERKYLEALEKAIDVK